MHRPQLTYANVMSTFAAFVALGGTSYAVARNSIGTPQLKDGAVTSAKVRNGALTQDDLAAGVLQAGPRGPRGVQGAMGPGGPPGASGAIGPAGPAGTLAAAEPWKALAPTNGWTNYGAPWESGSYRKDQLGIVHLRGLMTRASGAPTGQSVIATLPIGYRPKNGRIWVVDMGEAPQAGGRVDVGAGGQIVWASGPTGEVDYTSLDGIAFETD